MSMQMRFHYSYKVFVLKLNVTWFLWLLRECRLQDRNDEKKKNRKGNNRNGGKCLTDISLKCEVVQAQSTVTTIPSGC